jgi:hypothetical protein
MLTAIQFEGVDRISSWQVNREERFKSTILAAASRQAIYSYQTQVVVGG